MTESGTRDFTIPGGRCAVPNTAVAYSLNITVVPVNQLRWLTVWPAGQEQPLASTLNFYDGRIKANAAISPAGTGGAISIFATDPTHVIADVTGYFIPAGSAPGLAFYPVAPCRVADTRDDVDQLQGPKLSGGQTRKFQIQTASCNIPATAQAFSLNFTAISSARLGFLTAWPSGQTRPEVSTLNAPYGVATANAAIMTAGQGGNVSVFATDDTDLIVDINGYFAPPAAGGLSMYTLSPCRLVDTRVPGRQPPRGTLFLAPDSFPSRPCAVPSQAQAYVLNATVIPSGPLSFLTL